MPAPECVPAAVTRTQAYWEAREAADPELRVLSKKMKKLLDRNLPSHCVEALLCEVVRRRTGSLLWARWRYHQAAKGYIDYDAFVREAAEYRVDEASILHEPKPGYVGAIAVGDL